MARKPKATYRCRECGLGHSKWAGRCNQCGEWNTLDEIGTTAAKLFTLAEAEKIGPTIRQKSGLGEIDRVLGGGLVPGSLVLLGGEPGIGKSTLLAQMLAGLGQCNPGKVLYVSGEESVAQCAMRVRRVGADAPGLQFLSETSLEAILEVVDQERLEFLAIDSIQTIRSNTIQSAPGSVAQVRESALRLLSWAKRTNTATLLVGHVTKDGSLAGPKTLEHIVDVVFHFEGHGGSPYRTLRAVKNRFGSTQEVGVFEMCGVGLREVENPSQQFLAERPLGVPGSVVVASAEGSRPILVEVQALVAPPSAGIGRRTAAGVDGNRVALLLAVLGQRAQIDVISRDVFVNVAGGIRLTEPAMDLGILCAVASSAREQPIPGDTVVFGEVGLAGEVRGVSMTEMRLAEIAKLGFQRCILPAQSCKYLTSDCGLELVLVRSVKEAIH